VVQKLRRAAGKYIMKDTEQPQIKHLEKLIDLEEKNYKDAIALHKDYFTLRHVREKIRNLKEQLSALKGTKDQTHS